MDIPRPQLARRKRIRRILYGVAFLAVVSLVTLGLSRLKPAPPAVEKATVWLDTVKRGEMLRQVRGSGTLVPEVIRWVPAVTQGRVERILVGAGARLDHDTVILELSNPELEREVLDAGWDVKAAEAELIQRRVELESEILNERAAAASVASEFHQAELQAEMQEKLARDGLTSELELRRARLRAEEQATRHELEQQRLSIAAEAQQARLAVQRARVEQLRMLHQLRLSQLDALRVRPGIAGVLQQVPVDVGQQVAPGTNLARVAEPGRLKAEVRIAETQARDIEVGQTASVDTRNGVVPGRVSRIDPASQNGTVTVDVALLGELPKGARPDLSVDGTIELERLRDVLYVGRPAFGQESNTVGLFKLQDGGREAIRVQVKLGRSSVNSIEVLEGLKEGDRVILSDMSQWDAFDRVRLN